MWLLGGVRLYIVPHDRASPIATLLSGLVPINRCSLLSKLRVYVGRSRFCGFDIERKFVIFFRVWMMLVLSESVEHYAALRVVTRFSSATIQVSFDVLCSHVSFLLVFTSIFVEFKDELLHANSSIIFFLIWRCWDSVHERTRVLLEVVEDEPPLLLLLEL